MKKMFVLFLALAASVAFAGDIDVAKYNTGEIYKVKTAIPTVSGFPVNRLGTAASYTKTVDSTVAATAIGDLPTGTNKIAVYSTGALNFDAGFAPDTDLSAMSVATTTLTWFSGSEADLESLYFNTRAYPNNATAAVRYWPFGD